MPEDALDRFFWVTLSTDDDLDEAEGKGNFFPVCFPVDGDFEEVPCSCEEGKGVVSYTSGEYFVCGGRFRLPRTTETRLEIGTVAGELLVTHLMATCRSIPSDESTKFWKKARELMSPSFTHTCSPRTRSVKFAMVLLLLFAIVELILEEMNSSVLRNIRKKYEMKL